MNEGNLNASKWFQNVENIWKIHKTEKSKGMDANGRLDFQHGLSEQNLNIPYLVLYNSSAKDANATIVKRDDLNLDFIVESTTYVFYTQIINEAYYLASILNSSIPNLMMKDFQARGLFGARHVHKKILDIFFPEFDETNKVHSKLAELGRNAHEKVSIYLEENPPDKEVSGIHLGKMRTNIKKYLAEELKEIDDLVKKVIG